MYFTDQKLVLQFETFHYEMEVHERNNVTLSGISMNTMCQFFKDVFTHCSELHIPALSSLAHAIFDPSSKFAREFSITTLYGTPKIWITL